MNDFETIAKGILAAQPAPVPAKAKAPKVHWERDPNRQALCGICAKRGYDAPAQINADGGVTGLCAHHNEYERLLRAALRAGAPLTPEKAAAIRMDVTERMRLAR